MRGDCVVSVMPARKAGVAAIAAAVERLRGDEASTPEGVRGGELRAGDSPSCALKSSRIGVIGGSRLARSVDDFGLRLYVFHPP